MIFIVIVNVCRIEKYFTWIGEALGAAMPGRSSNSELMPQ